MKERTGKTFIDGPFNNRDYSNAAITENTCLSDPVRIVRAIVFAVTRSSFEFWRELRS